MGNESKAPKKSKIGEFFGVDLDGVRKACELGMNPAVAYMVLACFSDETNRYTPASVQAVEKYTGIGEKHAKQAIAALIDAKLVGLVSRDSTRPSYEIFGAPPAPPPPQVRAYGYREAKLAPAEQAAFESVELSFDSVVSSFRDGHALSAARRAVAKGWLIETKGSFAVREPPPPPPPPGRKMVWLPNELVKGIGGTRPIKRVRQTSDPLVLRMLVDLYNLQTLTSDGGIDRDTLYQRYKSECLGTIHEFKVWLFSKEGGKMASGPLSTAYKDPQKTVGDRFAILQDLGFIQWSIQLFDAPNGELQLPLGPMDDRELDYGNMTDALMIEHEIGMAAKKAGRALARELKKPSRIISDDEWLMAWIIPVLSHIAEPTVVGIARLRYRPKVSDTAKWYGTLMANKEASLKHFGGIYQRTLSVDESAANW